MLRRTTLGITLLSSLVAVLFSAACLAAETAPQVELKTNVGTIVIELYPEAAPKTVNNFLKYVKSGFYNNTIFHRVIDNFMIQGGGKGKDLKDKKTNPAIPLEAQLAFDHGIKNETGTIAMAREANPNTATSEFFINVADNDFLNPQPVPEGDPVQFMRRGTLRTMSRAEALTMLAGYAPFGRVIDGMAVVNQIKTVETEKRGENLNVPKNPVVILTAKVLKTPIKPKTIAEQLEPAEPVKSEMTPAPAETSKQETVPPVATPVPATPVPAN